MTQTMRGGEAHRKWKTRTGRNPARTKLVEFLDDVMRRRRVLPSQLAADLGISHATVSRWLSGKDTPSINSCRRLAEYTGDSLPVIMEIVGHIPGALQELSIEWPDFREYARHKYPDELDEDLVSMIEDLIERRRQRKFLSQTGKGS